MLWNQKPYLTVTMITFTWCSIYRQRGVTSVTEAAQPNIKFTQMTKPALRILWACTWKSVHSVCHSALRVIAKDSFHILHIHVLSVHSSWSERRLVDFFYMLHLWDSDSLHILFLPFINSVQDHSVRFK